MAHIFSKRKHKTKVYITLLITIIAVLVCTAVAFADGDSTTLDFEGFSIETSSTYPWTIYNGTCIQSGNAKQSNSVSVIKLTVVGSGVLTYDYRVYSSEVADETNPDSLLVSVNNEITTSTYYSSFTGQRYYGQTGWKSDYVVIQADDGESTDIYFAYKKNGSVDTSEDCALLKNISFNTGKATIEAASSNNVFGTVTGACEVFAGESVTLTAETKPGGKFFGWSVDGVYTENIETSYTIIAGKDTSIVGVFGSETDTVAQNRTTGIVYDCVSDALEDVDSDEVLILIKSSSLSNDAEIPSGVTLYVPYCEEYDADGSADGTTSDSYVFASENKTYSRLTINNGVTLDIKGTLLIGGVIGYPSQYYQGHTSGPHGRVTNNGTITVNGGSIDCYGFIDGSGTVEALSGQVNEPFVVFDFAGGNNCAQLYFNGQNSFMQYTMQNIECSLIIHDTAALSGYCNLYASSEFNKTDAPVPMIGGSVSAPKALIVLTSGATVSRTVNKSKCIAGATIKNDNQYGADIGQVTYLISGGASINKMDLKVWGFSISVPHFSIPYCWKYELTNGNYSIPDGCDIMPGGSMIVAGDATLTLGGRLYVLDGYKAGDMSGRCYPSSAELQNSGFSACGELVVDGEFIIGSAATFGGIIQTNGAGTVRVYPSSTVSSPKAQIGAEAYYDDDTCIMELNGRVRIGDSISSITPGQIYTATSGSEWTLESYTLVEYATDQSSTTQPTSGKYAKTKNNTYYIHAENETVTINQLMLGSFVADGHVDCINFVNMTYYDETDDTRTTASVATFSGGTATFTVSRTSAGSSYNYLVQYSIDSSAPITLQPDANGIYTIPSVTGLVTVTITSVKKGDVDLDGNVTVTDVTAMRRSLAGFEEITSILSLAAGDCDVDGHVTVTDVTSLRRFLAGYTNSL